MKKMLFAVLATMVLAVGFAACQEEIPPYLVVEDIDDDEHDFHGKAIVGVTDPAEVPAHVKIPNGIEAIGLAAFKGCESLKSVTIPKSVTRIGSFAFKGCENIEVAYIGTLKDWCAVDWDSSLLENAKSVTLSDGIDPRNLTKLDAGDLKGVTRIGRCAFYGCKSLKSVTIPDGVTEIGFHAFKGCEGIDVTYNGSLKDWCAADWDDSLLENANSITLSDGTDPRKLTKLDAGDLEGVTRIGKYAFYGCNSLKSVTIPASVTEIGSGAFDGCEGIDVTYTGTLKDWCAVDWNRPLLKNAKSITLSDGTDPRNLTKIDADDLKGVTRIGKYAFYGCNSLKSVTIPEGVTEIGYYAFEGCEGIDVTYAGTLKDWCEVDWDNGLLENAKSVTLSDGTDPRNLTKLDAGDLKGVTRIGSWAFYGCKSLKSVTIPDGVTEIGYYAFNGCTLLESATIPDSVTAIGGIAFKNCTSLASVTIPDSVTEIGWETFSGCASLVNVTIPKSVEEIGDYAFKGCTSLKSVTIADGVKKIGASAFRDCASLVSMTIPKSVTRIGSGAFKGCASLVNVTIPKSVEKIGNGAFDGCTSLKSVTIADGVKKIGASAFRDCASLVSVTIPGSTAIDVNAFKNCASLMTVTISEGVEKIGDDAFRDCVSLVSLTIPGSVTAIGKGAFYGCNSLKEVTLGCTTDHVLNNWVNLYSNLYLSKGTALRCTDGELVVN